MRIVQKQDFRIKDEDSDELQRQFIDFIFEHTGITPEFFVEKVDYSSVPTEVDPDGDVKPSHLYRKEMADDVYKRYQEFGTDHIVMLVHENNWIFKGIWGQNWSNVFHSYHFEICRYDRDNMVNSFNTLVHEVLHSLDAVIKSSMGVDINPIVEAWIRKEYANKKDVISYLDAKGFNWDRDLVHGNLRPPFGYIGRANIEWQSIVGKVLKLVSPHLRASYSKRKTLYMENVGLMEKLIFIAEKYLVLLRAVNNKKDGYKKV